MERFCPLGDLSLESFGIAFSATLNAKNNVYVNVCVSVMIQFGFACVDGAVDALNNHGGNRRSIYRSVEKNAEILEVLALRRKRKRPT